MVTHARLFESDFTLETRYKMQNLKLIETSLKLEAQNLSYILGGEAGFPIH